jgi:hypothetical protein
MYVDINKTGFTTFRWAAKSLKYLETSKDDPFCYLRYRCEVNPELTLGDLLRLLSKQTKLREFFATYSHCDLALFDLYLEGLKKDPIPSNVAFMQVAWATDFRHSEISIFSVFNGVDKDSKLFGFINTPLSTIQHARIILNKEVRFLDNEDDEEEEPWYATRSFTLLDVLAPIFWEIGFFGKNYATEFMTRVQVDN